MTEWQIIESEDFPAPPLEEIPRAGFRLKWTLLGCGIAAFFVALGFFGLQRQREESKQALRDDLTAYIFEEETLRYLGQPAAASITPYAPRVWQRAYWQTFETYKQAGMPPDTIQLGEIDFDGQCAVVTVDTTRSQERMRAYCLEQEAWLRAPVPGAAWGSETDAINFAIGVSLIFLPRDQPFAEALAVDLIPLFQKLEQWMQPPGTATLFGRNPYRGLAIVIEPHDLLAPLILDQEEQIIVNSPWLTPLQPSDGLAGEAAVRLALARTIARRAVIVQARTGPPLPGKTRFLSAAQIVAGIHTLLTPEARATLFEAWRGQLDEEWRSPFYADLLTTGYPNPTQQPALAAQFTAEYIYESAGEETLAAIIERIPEADSWDALFQATLNRSTITLEAEAANFAYNRRERASISPSKDTAPPARLPLTAKLLKLDSQEAGRRRLHVELPDRVEPLFIELPNQISFQTTTGEALAPECIPANSLLEIKGGWLEHQRRLAASQVTIQSISPLAIEAAPADTMAYLAGSETLYRPRSTSTNGIIYSNARAFLIDHPPSSQQITAPAEMLMALSQDGVLQPLIALSSTLKAFPLPTAAGEPAHFLFRLDLPNCKQSWLIHYKPAQGVAGYWLGPPAPTQWLWRADRQDILFFSPQEDHRLRHKIYQTNSSPFPVPIDTANTPLFFMGWNVKAGRLVSLNTWFDEFYLGLFDVNSGDLAEIAWPLYRPLPGLSLSPDGNWLAYLGGIKNLLGPPDRLDIRNVSDKRETTLVEVEAGEGLGTPIWSLNWDEPKLAVLAGPANEGSEPSPLPTQLIMAWPNQPDETTVVAQAAPDEVFDSPVFCADGALLYLAEQDGRYRLRYQRPGLRARTLLETDQPFYPLACE